MEEDLKDLLKESKKLMLEKPISEAIKEDFRIVIDSENGKAIVETKGSNASILVGLASLENSILGDIGITDETFCIIKEMIGIKNCEKEKFLKMKRYVIRDREAGNVIDNVDTIEQANEMLKTI